MFQAELTPNAEDDLARLDKNIAQRVLKKLRWMVENFEVVKHEALTGEWEGIFKLRVSDYRVLYTFDAAQQRIIVHFIRHRREVYKTK